MARQSPNSIVNKTESLAVKDKSTTVVGRTIGTIAVPKGPDNTITGARALSNKVKTLEGRRRALVKEYQSQAQVIVSTSPSYRVYFGKSMPIILNGIAVFVPLDGGQYRVPQSFASVFYERIGRVDASEVQQQKVSDIKNNIETYPGEKQLITRI